MCFSLTAITWRLKEDVDGTSININPLIDTCEVGMRRENDIKRKKEATKRGGGKKEGNTITFCNQICN